MNKGKKQISVTSINDVKEERIDVDRKVSFLLQLFIPSFEALDH